MFDDKLNSDDWRDVLNFDTDSEYSCEESGCDSEGICRCSRIVSVNVPTDFKSMHQFFMQAYPQGKMGLDKALDFWWVRRHFADMTFDFTAEGDYYGEVLCKVFPSDGNFLEGAAAFSVLSPVDKIKFMLMEEYEHVLPAIAAVKDWEMKPVFIEDVQQTANNRVSETQVDCYKGICQDFFALPNHHGYKDNDFQTAMQHLAPLCLKRGKFYQVIDGTHRTIALTSEYHMYSKKRNKKEDRFTPIFMWVICPKETK